MVSYTDYDHAGWQEFSARLHANHRVRLEHVPPARVCSVCGIDLDSDALCDRAEHETCPGGHTA
jgi:hypothetical protein